MRGSAADPSPLASDTLGLAPGGRNWSHMTGFEETRTDALGNTTTMKRSEIEYNDKDQTLRVFFRGGQIYDYFFVPENVADEFRRVCEDPAESAGKWFARMVRKTFEYQKVA
jgi:hypothetical protein